MRDWPESKVLRLAAVIANEQRTFYAKQTRNGMEQEVALYHLAETEKDLPVPAGKLVLLAGEQWLLLETASGIMLASSSNPQHHLSAVKALASFHELSNKRSWGARLPKVPDLRDHLPALADSVLGHVDQRVKNGIFTQVDLRLLGTTRQQLSGCWHAIQAQLNSYPVALIHGDCHGGNVFLAGTRITLIDFNSIAIGPGLLDMVGLLDVAARMGNQIGNKEQLLTAYWDELLPTTRQAYGDLNAAFQVLRICRALLELEWFVLSGEDYGLRTNRELAIISSCIEGISLRFVDIASP